MCGVECLLLGGSGDRDSSACALCGGDELVRWRSKASVELLTLVIATGRSLGEVYEQFSLTSPFANIFSKTVLGLLETEVGRGLRDCFILQSLQGIVQQQDLNDTPKGEILAGLKSALEDVKAGRLSPVEELWDDLDD